MPPLPAPPRYLRAGLTIGLSANNSLTTSQPDIKSTQIQLTGFLDKDTAPFCKELWNLCLSAQASPQGVPKELLEAKKLELIQEKVCVCVCDTALFLLLYIL